MKKIILTAFAFLCIVTLLLPNTTLAKQTFSDVSPTYTYYDEITYLLENNIISSSETYGINTIVTREEVAVMVAKAKGLDGTPRETKFKDIKATDKNSGYIQSAVEAGIINGFEDGSFKPNNKVTRGQMAAFIGRAFDLPTSNKTFKDMKSGVTGYEFVGRLAAANITTGYEDGTFKPSGNLKRVHLSLFVYRAIQYEQNGLAHPMKVHFIDVGQGDATFIELANSKNILVDAGTADAGIKVVAYLQKQNVSTLDYVIATHPDADHIGGMESVFKSFDVKTVLNSGKVHTTATYERFLTAVDKENATYIEPKTGQIFENDNSLKSSFQVLYSNKTATDNNDASLVVKANYCSTGVLLMADASREIEQKLITANSPLQANILKAGHHGSSTSSSLNFFNAVKPKDIILSYGEENDYGHPHKEVLANIKTIGAKAYSTVDGDIVATINCDNYSIKASEFKFNVEPENGDVNSGTYVIPDAPTKFKNCTEVRAYYPNGIKKSHPSYEEKFDGDKDGWACEPPR